MLDSAPPEMLLEWAAYDELEPFGEERADLRSAQVAHALWNIARDQARNPDGWTIDEFTLKLGDVPGPPPKKPQTVEYQEMLIDAWCVAANAIHGAK